MCTCVAYTILYIAAVVGIDGTAHEASEGDCSVEICVTVDNPRNSSLTVQLSIINDTAGGDREKWPHLTVKLISFFTAVFSEDYGGCVSVDVTLAECSMRECITIPIIDDKMLEYEEVFYVTLTLTPGGADGFVLGNVATTVTISDNDSE